MRLWPIVILFSIHLNASELLELDTWDCKSQIELSGKWDFYWGKFIDTSFQPSEYTIDCPSFWQGLVVNGEELPSFGYCSFRKKITVPESEEFFGLYIEHIHSAYKVIINGKDIYESGIVAKTKEEYRPVRLPKVIPLPQGNNYDIIIHASNFDHYRGGIVKAPLLVNLDTFEKLEERARFIDTFIAGGTGLVGLTFMIIFLFSRRTPEVVFFALLSLSLSIRLLMAGIYPLHAVMDVSHSFHWMIRVEYVALFLLVVFGSMYISNLFPSNKEKRIYNLVAVAGLIYVTTALFCPIKCFTALTPSFLLINLTLLILYAITVIRGAFNNNRSAWILLLGIVIVFLWAVMDTMVYFGFIEVNRIYYSILFLAFIMVNNLALMDRFAHEIIISKERQALIESSESRKLLMSMISHEIKTPVAHLQMNSEMLEHFIGQVDKETILRERIIPRIKSGINSIKEMLNDFIYFMNIDKHKPEHLYKSELIDKLRSIFSLEVFNKFSHEFSFQTNVKVLLYAISTFVSNAKKYTPEGKPKPEINLGFDEQRHFIEIKDYGVGMDEERLKKMGDLQLDTSDILEVHGIGFYLAKKLLESIGHHVRVESTLNKGTSVYISL